MTNVIVTIEVAPRDFDLIRASVIQTAVLSELELDSSELNEDQRDMVAERVAQARRLAEELGS